MAIRGTGRQVGAGMSRREFGARLSALGLAAGPISLLPSRAAAAPDLSLFTWAGYEIPELHPAYLRAHGASPESSFFGNEEEALQKLRAGFKADLAHPCSSSVLRWHEAGILKPVDVTRLTRWNDLLDPLKSLPGTRAGDEVLWIPFDWGSNSIVYRTDLVDRKYHEENSWELLWDDAYAGRIGMWDSVDGAVAMAAAMLGISDTANVTDAQFEQIRDLLAAQSKLVPFYWDSETTAEASLASGEYVASYLWSASVARLKENGVPVEYMLNPKEGIVSFACGLVMLNDGPGDEDAKYEFIDAMLDPEAGKYLIEAYGYGHSNQKSYDVADPEILRSQGLDGDVGEYMSKTSFFQYWPAEVRQRYIEMWEAVKRS